MSRTIVVGVSAGIAAYKAAILVRELIRAGHDVRVVPTPRSLDFVGAATWEGLTGRPVHATPADQPGGDHVELARITDLIVIAPATADVIARVRAGMADDLLTATVLASHCPLVIAPAMHSQMWLNAATQDNISVLAARGATIVGPASGALGSGDYGIGRLIAPEEIAARVLSILDAPHDLEGRRLLVSAGGTHEPLDPVRFIGNASSGRQGIEIARAAALRGAEVTLVASNIESSLLAGLDRTVALVDAPSAADVEREVMSRLASADALVMAAAVADFRPSQAARDKIKKDPETNDAPVIALERTTDVLFEACRHPDRPRVVVGFAAETGGDARVLELGAEKARRKGADLLAVNRVGDGRGFGDVANEIHLLDATGAQVAHASGTKRDVAHALVDAIAAQLSSIAE